MLQRQGQNQGPVAAEPAVPVSEPTPSRQRETPRRTTPAEFLREVRNELRRVAWPSRPEVINYSTVVLVTLVVLVSMIFLLNYLFSKAVLFLFNA
ncbi:MAG TPA: preprotein translocase subunit SecE [Acidimicrobiales bacterium]|jgi:preprotein translocase subunit SecE|nr:preprotein translocase subunit SecE [Acidimicrobiales bacterium]